MAQEDVSRKLVAIVSADVVGYSRLMAEDEQATLSDLRAHRSDLIDPAIARNNGRIVKVMGDGILIEFASVVDAVQTCVTVQRMMRERNAETSEDRRLEFRVGVNVGEVVVDGDDIYGDGVNVAARLQEISIPGGISVSDRVYADTRGKLDVQFEDTGLQTLKNIPEPVRVYRVTLDGKSGQVSQPPDKKNFALLASGIAVIALVIGSAGLYWWQSWNMPAAPEVASAYQLPDKPSIAVLPFHNMSDDKAQAYFADGMAEDIITDLSKFSGLFVIARNSSFQYRGDNIDVKKVGRELGVKYVLEGSVRRAEDQVRITAQLIDAQTGGHLWAERYDGSLADVFALQDKVTGEIVKALAITFEQGEEAAFGQQETKNVEAYDEFLAGWAYYTKTTPENFKKAIVHFERAISLDSVYSRPHAALAALYSISYGNFWHLPLGYDRGPTGHAQLRTKRDNHLKEALAQPTALALSIEARRYIERWSFDKARSTAMRAIRLAPGAPDGYVALAWVLTVSGEGEEAVRQMKTAMRLQPHYPWSYTANLGTAYLIAEKYERAEPLLEEATRRNPNSEFHLAMLAIAYAYLGRKELAQKSIDKWRQVTKSHGQPMFESYIVHLRWHFKNEVDREHLRKGLIKAGAKDLG